MEDVKKNETKKIFEDELEKVTGGDRTLRCGCGYSMSVSEEEYVNFGGSNIKCPICHTKIG